LTRPRSMVRADWTVAKVRSNMEASSRTVRRQFFSTAVVAAATTSSVHLFFFCVRVALIRGRFLLLHSFYDTVYLAFRQGLVPVGSVDQWFDFFSAFPALARAATKSPTSVIALSEGGCGYSCCWVVTASLTADRTGRSPEELHQRIAFSAFFVFTKPL
jgi:hypothetical protein